MTSGPVPPPDELARALPLFGVPEADRASLQQAYELVCRGGPAAAWVATVGEQLDDVMGEPTPGPVLPARGGLEAAEAAFLPVVAYTEVLPLTLALHADQRVPPDVTEATLADVGRMLARNRVWYSEPGLRDDLATWLTRHLHGALFQVGRLQYERLRLDSWTASQLRSAGVAVESGDLALNLHIPEVGGPLTGEAVSESLAEGRDFFSTRFGAEEPAVAICSSWLLDPQLADHLPESSNILAFQRFFEIGPRRDDDGDASVRKFVFGDTATALEDLPQRTSLERAVVRHLRAGGRWHVHIGWMPWC